MTPRPLDRLLRRIADTEREEITCSECFELLPAAVERELTGATDTPLHARLRQHLGQCGVCREEFEVLRDFVRSPQAAAPRDPAE
ncbi:MAG: hypothetical protein ACREJR_12415 [Candidatus Rokuibacteriota bacterium]